MVRPKNIKPFTRKMFSTWQQMQHCRKQKCSGHHHKALHALVREDAQRHDVGSREENTLSHTQWQSDYFSGLLHSALFPSAVYSCSLSSSTHLHLVRNRHISGLAVLQSSFSLLLPSFHSELLKASEFFQWLFSTPNNLAAKVQKTTTAVLRLP